MKEPQFRVFNLASRVFCDFTTYDSALIFYQDGKARQENYVFIVLHPETFASIAGQTDPEADSSGRRMGTA